MLLVLSLILALKRRFTKHLNWKSKFESDDDLPMNEPVKLNLLTIIIRCVFSEDDKF